MFLSFDVSIVDFELVNVSWGVRETVTALDFLKVVPEHSEVVRPSSRKQTIRTLINLYDIRKYIFDIHYLLNTPSTN